MSSSWSDKFERLHMKSKSWQKNWVVVMHSDYDNTWIEKTIPCTYLQAVRFVYAKHWDHSLAKGTVRIVSVAELQSIKV